MDKLRTFLDRQDKIIAEDREKTLIALGLSEKEYAPDNAPAYLYPQSERINGVTRHYREVAISVSDEEYAQILAKCTQVEEIRKKEKAAEKERQNSGRLTKKWLPVFEAPKEESAGAKPAAPIETGKSRLSFPLRILAAVLAGVGILSGFVTLIGDGEPFVFLVTLALTAVEALLFFGLAEILDRLALLTAIASQGYRYSESRDKK